jgi:hypothetical protein
MGNDSIIARASARVQVTINVGAKYAREALHAMAPGPPANKPKGPVSDDAPSAQIAKRFPSEVLSPTYDLDPQGQGWMWPKGATTQEKIDLYHQMQRAHGSPSPQEARIPSSEVRLPKSRPPEPDEWSDPRLDPTLHAPESAPAASTTTEPVTWTSPPTRKAGAPDIPLPAPRPKTLAPKIAPPVRVHRPHHRRRR